MTTTLLPTPEAPGVGRRLVRTACLTAGLRALTDTAELLVSELLTNAVVHARSELVLDIRPDGEELWVGVSDLDSRRPTRYDADPEALGGRGLAIVERLADAWGITEAPGGKTVWFCLRLPAIGRRSRLREDAAHR